MISRRAGELYGLKNRRQIFVISIGITLGFSELIWGISFLPFPFYILGGIFTVIFAAVFDIIKEYFKQRFDLFASLDENKFRKILIRDIVSGAILIIFFIFITPWLPVRY